MDIKQYTNRFEELHQKDLFNELTNIDVIQFSLGFKDHTLPLNNKEFYFSKPVINLFNEHESLIGEVKKDDFESIYLSYKTLNNRFNESPKESLINLNNIKTYKFYIAVESDETLEVIPYIINYSNRMKKKLTKVIEYGQTMDFRNYDQCRLTFKLVGHGHFKIKNITIIPKG